ncbi:MAG: hypothetical protein EOM35_02285 [Negativicutes bacterium]|nr:hypothetical protein [Negativicutes bacterium]
MILIDKLLQTTSTIEKQAIVAASKNGKHVPEVLLYTYSPYKTFGVTFSSHEIDMARLGTPNSDMIDLLDLLSARRLTGLAARNEVVNFALTHGDLIKCVCNKNLNCGIAASIINKAFGYNLIPVFNVQLAKAANLDRISFPVIAQLKYNGARCLAILNYGEITLKTRNGHAFKFPRLEKMLRSVKGFSSLSIVLDGELTFGDSRNEDHTKISGLVNSSRQGTPIPDHLGIVYNIFDILTIDQFSSMFCNVPYSQRFNSAKDFVELLNCPSDVCLADSWLFTNVEDLLAKYQRCISSGYEGLILKSLQHLYSFKRSNDWAKMKAELTTDLLCIDCVPGEGKYQGCIGALKCEGYMEDAIKPTYIEVKVGSGLTDADRRKDPNFFIGKTIEIKYNTVIANKDNLNKSLFLPRFVCVREDK